MKALRACIFFVFCLSLSCKKDSGKVEAWFGPSFPDAIYKDSVVCIIINYSDYSEFKNDQELNNHDLFRYSSKIYPESPDYCSECTKFFGFLNLDAGNTYVLKKFDLVNKSGKIIYYLPWNSDSINTSGYTTRLPFIFKSGQGRMSFEVERYPGK
jgi:hypothetical protein